MKQTIPERRRTTRIHQTTHHGVVAARVTPGTHARLIDVSAGGALIETSHRLLPGTPVELHMETKAERSTVRGRVLRCAVVRVRPSFVCYRGAVGFDHPMPWFVDAAEHRSSVDARAGTAMRADDTRQVL
jgi:hypothetical protein